MKTVIAILALSLCLHAGTVVSIDLSGTSRTLEAAIVGSTNAEHACTVQETLMNGFFRNGKVISSEAAATAVACSQKCFRSIKGCVAINFKTADKTCSFLSENGQVSAKKGYISTLVRPEAINPCDDNNFVLQHRSPGRALPGNPRKANTAVECCKICLGHPECMSWIFHDCKFLCYIKHVPAPIVPNGGSTTGILCQDISGL